MSLLDLDPSYPEVLAVIARTTDATLVAAGIAPELSAEMALAAAEAVRSELGGTMHYIPLADSWMQQQRNRRILGALAARPGRYAEVAREFAMSEQHIRRIEARATEAERARRQTDLFGAAGSD